MLFLAQTDANFVTITTKLHGFLNLAIDIGAGVLVYTIAVELIKYGASGGSADPVDKKCEPSGKLVLDEEELGFFDARRTYYGDETSEGKIRLRGFGESGEDDY